MNEHTSTEQTRPDPVYLVGSEYAFRAYLRDRGVPDAGPEYARHVHRIEHLRGVPHTANILFLHDWETLVDGHRIQVRAAYLRAVRLGEL